MQVDETGDGHDTSGAIEAAALDALAASHVIASPVEPDGTSGIPTRSSRWRPNRLLGKVVPPLLASFILSGWHFVNATIGATESRDTWVGHS